MNTLILKRREPFEVIFLALLTLTALTQLISGSRPGSIIAFLPGWFATTWALLTLLGSLLALAGITLPGAVTGLFLERLGLTISAWTILIYGGTVSVFGGLRGSLTIALCLAVLAAFLIRRRELTVVIRQLPTSKTLESDNPHGQSS